MWIRKREMSRHARKWHSKIGKSLKASHIPTCTTWWPTVASRLQAVAVAFTLAALMAVCGIPAAQAAAKSDDFTNTAALTAFGMGARPLGMGGAFAAVADDANALYYNPAGLSTLQEGELTSMYASQFGLLNTYAAGYSQDGWGAGLLRYQLGDIERRDEFANEVGDRFSVGEQMIIGSYAARVGPVDLGASLKYYSQTLADVSGSGITTDLGALWQPAAAPYRLGVVVRDALGAVSYNNDTRDAFDRIIVLGAAYRHGPWLAALDQELPGFLRLGTEYEASELITLRAGAYGDEQWTFTAGLGVTIAPYEVQYAYEQPSVLAGTHRLSFGMRF